MGHWLIHIFVKKKIVENDECREKRDLMEFLLIVAI